MTLLAAVAIVAAGSLLLRAVPLLTARHVPERLADAAGWAGLGVIAAMTVRGLLGPSPGCGLVTQLPALLAAGVGVLLAVRRVPTLIAVASGLGTYLLLAPLTSCS